jgi:hypothetical protein
MTAGYIACVLFIIPAPVAPVTGDFTIQVISGNAQEGYPMLPLKDPIAFKLIDKTGNPVNSTVVQFSIIPGGTVSPASDTSDKDGIVKVKVTAGSETGTYIITATSQDVTQKATATIKNG